LLDETFDHGNSFLHQADPRGKVFCAFLLVCAIAILHRLSAAGVALIAGCLFVRLAHLSGARIIKRLLMVNTFIAFLWLFLPFSVPGKVIFSIWKWGATVEGIELAILITAKCNAILLVIISFVATTPIPQLGFALTRLRIPEKLILLMLIGYRYLSVIQEEYDRLLEAAKIRCFVPKNNMRTYRTYAYLLAMVLVRSYERGVTVYQAMLLRGFNGKFHCLQRFHFGRRDLILVTSISLCAIFLLYLDNCAVF